MQHLTTAAFVRYLILLRIAKFLIFIFGHELHAPSKHVLEQFLLDDRAERLRTVLSRRTDSLTIVIDQIHHAHNISAVLRSADAFGLQQVQIIGKQLSPSTGISLGAERWLSIHHHKSPADAVSFLKQAGYSIAILEPPREEGPPTVPVYELPFRDRLAVVFGNEKFGVSAELKEAASWRAHIPMFGFVESFNISVAAAITLFCSTFSGAKPERQPQSISSVDAEKILDEWLRDEVRGSTGVLERLTEAKE